jgi:hypothetical protein
MWFWIVFAAVGWLAFIGNGLYVAHRQALAEDACDECDGIDCPDCRAEDAKSLPPKE